MDNWSTTSQLACPSTMVFSVTIRCDHGWQFQLQEDVNCISRRFRELTVSLSLAMWHRHCVADTVIVSLTGSLLAVRRTWTTRQLTSGCYTSEVLKTSHTSTILLTKSSSCFTTRTNQTTLSPSRMYQYHSHVHSVLSVLRWFSVLCVVHVRGW